MNLARRALMGAGLGLALAVAGCAPEKVGLETKIERLIAKQEVNEKALGENPKLERLPAPVKDWEEIREIVLSTTKELTGKDYSNASVRILSERDAKKCFGERDSDGTYITGKRSPITGEILIRRLDVWQSLLTSYHEIAHDFTKRGKQLPLERLAEALKAGGRKASFEEIRAIVDASWTREQFEEKILLEASCESYSRWALSYTHEKYLPKWKLGCYFITSEKTEGEAMLYDVVDELCNDVYVSLRNEDGKASCIDLLGEAHKIIEDVKDYNAIRVRLSEKTIKRVDEAIQKYSALQERLRVLTSQTK